MFNIIWSINMCKKSVFNNFYHSWRMFMVSVCLSTVCTYERALTLVNIIELPCHFYVIEVCHRMYGTKNKVCSINCSITGTHNRIPLYYDLWGIIVCGAFDWCCDISYIMRLIGFTEVDCDMLFTKYRISIKNKWSM